VIANGTATGWVPRLCLGLAPKSVASGAAIVAFRPPFGSHAMSPILRRLVLGLGLLLLGGALSGCIIEEGPYYHHHGGYCYWHPYRC
jgi:hypothetical protein